MAVTLSILDRSRIDKVVAMVREHLFRVTNRKSHKVPIGTKIDDLKMTLNGVMTVILRFFAKFGSFRCPITSK